MLIKWHAAQTIYFLTTFKGNAILKIYFTLETDSERHLDPRAGRVDVFMPEIPFEAQEIIDVLEEIKYKDYTNVKTRQLISRIVNK